MTEIELLQIPPTDAEVAALGVAASEGLSAAGRLLLRRLAFDRDRLKTETERLRRVAADAKARMWETGHDNDRLIAEVGEWRKKAKEWEGNYEVESRESEITADENKMLRQLLSDAEWFVRRYKESSPPGGCVYCGFAGLCCHLDQHLTEAAAVLEEKK